MIVRPRAASLPARAACRGSRCAVRRTFQNYESGRSAEVISVERSDVPTSLKQVYRADVSKVVRLHVVSHALQVGWLLRPDEIPVGRLEGAGSTS